MSVITQCDSCGVNSTETFISDLLPIEINYGSVYYCLHLCDECQERVDLPAKTFVRGLLPREPLEDL